MRIFDVIGGLAVAVWLTVSGLYIYDQEFAGQADSESLGSDVVLSEGKSWMILQRKEEDVGFVKRSNTRLKDGWLVEYEMLMLLDVLGNSFPIDTSVKATLDPDGYLRDFNAEVKAVGRDFTATGEVEGREVSVVMNTGGEPSNQTVRLEERPRLSSSAVNQLLAKEDLEPGDVFEEEYFNPTSMGPTKIRMEYQGSKEVEIYGEKIQSKHIVQKVAGNTLDVYVNDEGQLLIQEFPMRMIGTRAPPELGRARETALRKKVRSAHENSPGKIGSEAAGLPSMPMGPAMKLLGLGGSEGESADEAPEKPTPETDSGISPPGPDSGPAAAPDVTGDVRPDTTAP